MSSNSITVEKLSKLKLLQGIDLAILNDLVTQFPDAIFYESDVRPGITCYGKNTDNIAEWTKIMDDIGAHVQTVHMHTNIRFGITYRVGEADAIQDYLGLVYDAYDDTQATVMLAHASALNIIRVDFWADSTGYMCTTKYKLAIMRFLVNAVSIDRLEVHQCDVLPEILQLIPHVRAKQIVLESYLGESNVCSVLSGLTYNTFTTLINFHCRISQPMLTCLNFALEKNKTLTAIKTRELSDDSDMRNAELASMPIIADIRTKIVINPTQ